MSALGRWDAATAGTGAGSGAAATGAGAAGAGGAHGERSSGPLTEREVEILQSIAGGWTTAQIAEAFAISEHTVRSHVKRILLKLDAHSKAEAVSKGVRLGLISTDPSEPAP
jgi:DNA-binding CsgD family transcriptional regulator